MIADRDRVDAVLAAEGIDVDDEIRSRLARQLAEMDGYVAIVRASLLGHGPVALDPRSELVADAPNGRRPQGQTADDSPRRA